MLYVTDWRGGNLVTQAVNNAHFYVGWLLTFVVFVSEGRSLEDLQCFMSAGANSPPWQHEDLQCFIRRGKDTETMTQRLARSLCLLIGRAMSPTRRMKICNVSCQQGKFAETKNAMFRFIMSPTSHRRSVVLIIGKYPITIRKRYSDYDYRLSY